MWLLAAILFCGFIGMKIIGKQRKTETVPKDSAKIDFFETLTLI